MFDDYTANGIEVVSYNPYIELDSDTKIDFKFSFEIECRSYGIKDVSILFQDQTFDVLDTNGNTVSFSIEQEKTEFEYEDNGFNICCFIDRIELFWDRDGKKTYTKICIRK